MRDVDFAEFLQTNQIDGLLSFLYSIDWRDPWIIGLVFFHIAVFLTAISTRRHGTFQALLFFMLLLLVYFSENINQMASTNWRIFSRQQYFDSNGLFISIVFSMPILLNCMMMVVSIVRAFSRRHLELSVGNHQVRNAPIEVLPGGPYLPIDENFLHGGLSSMVPSERKGSLTLPTKQIEDFQSFKSIQAQVSSLSFEQDRISTLWPIHDHHLHAQNRPSAISSVRDVRFPMESQQDHASSTLPSKQIHGCPTESSDRYHRATSSLKQDLRSPDTSVEQDHPAFTLSNDKDDCSSMTSSDKDSDSTSSEKKAPLSHDRNYHDNHISSIESAELDCAPTLSHVQYNQSSLSSDSERISMLKPEQARLSSISSEQERISTLSPTQDHHLQAPSTISYDRDVRFPMESQQDHASSTFPSEQIHGCPTESSDRYHRATSSLQQDLRYPDTSVEQDHPAFTLSNDKDDCSSMTSCDKDSHSTSSEKEAPLSHDTNYHDNHISSIVSAELDCAPTLSHVQYKKSSLSSDSERISILKPERARLSSISSEQERISTLSPTHDHHLQAPSTISSDRDVRFPMKSQRNHASSTFPSKHIHGCPTESSDRYHRATSSLQEDLRSPETSIEQEHSAFTLSNDKDDRSSMTSSEKDSDSTSSENDNHIPSIESAELDCAPTLSHLQYNQSSLSSDSELISMLKPEQARLSSISSEHERISTLSPTQDHPSTISSDRDVIFPMESQQDRASFILPPEQIHGSSTEWWDLYIHGYPTDPSDQFDRAMSSSEQNIRSRETSVEQDCSTLTLSKIKDELSVMFDEDIDPVEDREEEARSLLRITELFNSFEAEMNRRIWFPTDNF